MVNVALEHAAVFDEIAATYDADFTHTALGYMLRTRVWNVMEKYFRPGDHILELNCGTGEDARWMAQRGIRLTMTDASPSMLTIAVEKIASHSHQVVPSVLSFTDFCSMQWPDKFDGILSNFGGLNLLEDRRILARRLAECTKPKSVVIMVLMGPFCPFEIIYNMVMFRPAVALRRVRRSDARIGSHRVRITYPRLNELLVDFQPYFQLVHAESLGILLPTTHHRHVVERFPRFFRLINKLDSVLSLIFKGIGDHYIAVLQRV